MTKQPTKLLALLALKTPLPELNMQDDNLRFLAERYPDVEFRHVEFNPNRIDHLDDADILFAYIITPSLLAQAKRLKWFHSVVTGPDTYTFPELVSRNIHVTSPRGVYSEPIAESVLGMMLALARPLGVCIKAQSQAKWTAQEIYSAPLPPCELAGSTVMIVGMGGIGKAVARRCRSFGMHIIGVVRNESPHCSEADETIPFNRLHDELPRADFVVLACPLTTTTLHIINATTLSMMKRSAFLVNIARGQLIDEEALLNALRKGTIAGAACDAFTTEPLPAGHPLFSEPNMIVTPHVSGFSNRFWEHALERFAENLTKFIEGKPLIGEVDFQRGY